MGATRRCATGPGPRVSTRFNHIGATSGVVGDIIEDLILTPSGDLSRYAGDEPIGVPVADTEGGYRPDLETREPGENYHFDANEFFVLGPIEVVAADVPLEIGGPKERAALAALAAWAGRVLSTEQLTEALWGDNPPRSSGKVLQNLVLRLRRTLGPDVIATRSGGYELRASPEAVDARRFERLVAEGRAGFANRDAAGVEALSAALALWRSNPLPEVADWPPARAEIARLEEMHRCLVEDLAEAELDIGHHREWVGRLEAMVFDEPLRERRWGLFMVALYRCGRQVDALRIYQRARATLGELGLEPGPDLRAIEQAISSHDASLAAPGAERVGRPLPTGVVTFLLTDIEGSTPLWERVPDAMSAAIQRHDELIEHAVSGAGGVVLKARGEGDSTFCVFTKTSSAVSAALAAREALAAHQWPEGLSLPVRMAIHTGEAHERDGDYLGPTINRAARLRGLANGGQILLSEPVAALVRDDLPEGWDLVELGEQALRGLGRPERVFTLIGSGAVVGRGATLIARSCPYLGLLPFQAEDDRVFFGRTEVLSALMERLARDRFVTIVGASGSGKSSLLRAGLVAGLKRSALLGSAGWTTIVFTPGARPLAELAAHLGPVCGDSAVDLLHDVESDPRALDVAIRQSLSTLPPQSKILLVIDQLEELFTLCKDEEDRRRFLDAVVDAASALDAPSVIVTALRADFFGHLAAHAAFARLLERHTLLLGPMDDRGLRDAIEGPARVVGLTLEPGLVNVIVGDVAGEPGALPLLSHALLEVWTRREGRMLTIAGYQASGGVAGAIARSADTAYDKLDPVEQRIARGVFLRLTELGDGTEDTRRRATLDELADHDPAAASRTETVLATLAAARLVTVAEETVEVAHEALIREWPRLRTWLDEDRDGLRVMRHVTYAARDWAERGRDDTELYRGHRLATALEWRAAGHHDDLNALEHEFLDAGQREFAERARAQARAARRLRALVAGTGVALVIAVIAGLVAVGQRNEANDARDRADAAAHAETVRRLAAQSQLTQDTNLSLALLLALEANRRDDSFETRGALQSALLSNPELLGFLRGSAESYNSVSISPSGLVAAGSRDGTVDLWTAHDRRLVGTLPVGRGRVVVDFAPDGVLLAVLSEQDHRLSVWDTSSRTMVGGAFTDEAALASSGTFAFSPDGQHLTASVRSGEIATWNLATRQETGHRLTSDAGGAFRAVEYSPDGRVLAAGTEAGRVVLYDAATGAPIAPMLAPGPNSTVISLGFDPRGSRLVAGSRGGSTYMWDLTTGQHIASSVLDGITNAELAFSPDGGRLAAGSTTETVDFLDAEQPNVRLASVHTQGGVVLGTAYSPDGRYVATANINGTISIIDVVGERKLGRPLATEPPQSATFSPDGSVLASANNHDGSLSLLDAESGRVLHRLKPPGMRPVDVLLLAWPAFSPDSRRVAYGGLTGHVAIFDVGTGNLVTTLTPPPATTDQPFTDPAIMPLYVGPLAFSPDGTKLASAAFETATIFDLRSGQPQATVAGWDTLATTITFTPDSEHLVVSGYQSVTLVFDSDTGEQVGPPIGDSTAPAYLASIGPGDLLATSDFSGTIRIIDLPTRTQVGPPIVGPPVPVSGVHILPGGHELIATFYSAAGEAQLFDIATAQPIGDPFPSLGPYSAAAVSPDGSTLITGDGVRMIRWDLNPDHWRTTACSVAGRNLTPAEWAQYLPSGEPYRATCPEHTS
jgi:WD40 repeat protein/class 3 adenylate cyclase/DNA-binding winged helix-turn-helix (wHTH) protein